MTWSCFLLSQECQSYSFDLGHVFLEADIEPQGLNGIFFLHLFILFAQFSDPITCAHSEVFEIFCYCSLMHHCTHSGNNRPTTQQALLDPNFEFDLKHWLVDSYGRSWMNEGIPH